jgi:hypothetical protein
MVGRGLEIGRTERFYVMMWPQSEWHHASPMPPQQWVLGKIRSKTYKKLFILQLHSKGWASGQNSLASQLSNWSPSHTPLPPYIYEWVMAEYASLPLGVTHGVTWWWAPFIFRNSPSLNSTDKFNFTIYTSLSAPVCDIAKKDYNLWSRFTVKHSESIGVCIMQKCTSFEIHHFFAGKYQGICCWQETSGSYLWGFKAIPLSERLLLHYST